MRCEICDTEIPDGATECPRCGFEVEWMRGYTELPRRAHSTEYNPRQSAVLPTSEGRATRQERSRENIGRSQTHPNKRGRSVILVLVSLIVGILIAVAGFAIYSHITNRLDASPSLGAGGVPADVVPDADTGTLNEDNEDNKASWSVRHYVDDFGDETDSTYIGAIFNGTFSNTATSNSPLSVIVCYNYGRRSFSFRLLEYDRVRATYSKYDDIKLKYKFTSPYTPDEDHTFDEELEGTAPNGDLYLYWKESIIADEVFGGDADMIETCLKEPTDVRCLITIGSSEYIFDMDGSGFQECLDEVGVLD